MAENKDGSVLAQTGAALAEAGYGSDHGSYWQKIEQEWNADQRSGKGYVWTVTIGGEQEVTLFALAGCKYRLQLSASHVGPSVNGVYKGRLRMEYQGNVTGLKLIMLAAGIRTGSELSGWFESDPFFFKLEDYRDGDEYDFVSSFDQSEELTTVKPTGNAAADLLAQQYVDTLMGLVGTLTGNTSSDEQSTAMSKHPSAFWFDYSIRMTGGNMEDFIKMNGGPLVWNLKMEAKTNGLGTAGEADAAVSSLFFSTVRDRAKTEIEDPYPYSVKVYPDGSAAFTLYNVKDPSNSVVWPGKIDKVPVGSTSLVE